ncbi:immunoglobulin-like domain-containing protein [Paenibacillus dauci]|uniref:immunoglobulin-like domain-containing protein n=1 Tax=Paenibacillus dauci TaxID=1567106 RepID=UPI00061A04A3|nr:immunoglobulin-like domain-containing protein [Paenibacillus dauci]
MKKFISTCLAFSLVMPGVTGNAAFAAETSTEDVSATMDVPSSTLSDSLSTDVQSSVYELPVISPLPSSKTVSDIVYKPDQLYFPRVYDMTYRNGEVYFLQISNGISKISLTTGKTTTILKSNYYSIQSIAVDSQDNLYYIELGSPYIKKVSLRSLQLPLTYKQLLNASTDYAKYSSSSSNVKITGMAFDSNDQLYIAISGQNSENLSGVMKWNSASQSLQPVLSNTSSKIEKIAFDSQDNLYIDTYGYSTTDGITIRPGIQKIEASSLRSLPINDKMLTPYKTYSELKNLVYGMIFLPDGTSYSTDGTTIRRIFMSDRPLITLNGESSITLINGETYQEAGAYAEDQKYHDLKTQITYSLNGKPVEAIDTHMVGTYTVHYNVTTPDQRSAKEVTRTVVIKEIPKNLTEVDFSNPVSMDYANNAVYIANPATMDNPDGGIYKVSLKDYSRKLIAKLSDVRGIAVSNSGDLYFSTVSDYGSFFKLESRYLNENQPLMGSALWAVAEEIRPFSAELSAKGTIRITGLDFDNQGRLYISANQPFNSYGEHALIIRSLDDTLSSFQQFGEGDDIIRKNLSDIADIEISPGGNLYANFTGFNYHGTYKIPASVLQEDQPILTSNLLGEDVGSSSQYHGITFLPNGEGYATMMNYPELSIYKLPFYDRAPTSPGAEDAYRLENLNIPTPYGMAYYKDQAYIAQGDNGLSKVDLSTRTVTQLVYGSNTLNLRAVTVDSKGGLYYTVPNAKNPEYTYIKKIDAASLNQPLTVDQLLAKSINYAYIHESKISGLAMDKNNQLYISLDKGWDLDPGLLRWNNASKTLTPVSEEASMITAITFDNQGNLYFKTPSPQSYYSYAAGIVKISAADLKGTLPVADEKLISYKQDVLRNEPYNGLLFLSDGTSYFSNGQSLKRVYPESRPIVTLEGYSDAVVQGDIYTDPGIRVIEDEKYSKFDIKVTYSFDGEFVPSLDTSKVGTYTIHYVAVNPAGTASLEKTREVTVKPTPSQLTDWYITGINSMDADSQNLYLTNYSYKDNPNYGLYKISLQTMQKTRLAAINDIGAVAVNASGDLFFTRYDMDNMIFKIEAKHLQSGKALTADQLMKLSRTYMPFTAKEASAAPLKVNGLEFDKQGRLYAAVNVYGKTSVTSKIVRLTGNDWNKSTLITELPVSSNDLDFSSAGDLYISTQELYTTWRRDTYKISSQQLNTLPIQTNNLTKIPYTEGDKGIAFLADGTGYVSRTDDFEKRKQTILKFNY